MPSSDRTRDSEAEGAGRRTQPGDQGMARKAQTQEEGMFRLRFDLKR